MAICGHEYAESRLCALINAIKIGGNERCIQIRHTERVAAYHNIGGSAASREHKINYYFSTTPS